MTLPSTETLLHKLGWDDGWEASFAEHRAAGLVPARVAIQHRGAYDLLGEAGETRASATTRLFKSDELPAVGDWVGLDPTTNLVEAVLERRSSISRKEVWHAAREQVLAANIDVAFLVQALPLDFNVRRLERYLAMAWESGAQPVVLVTKTDLVDDVDAVPRRGRGGHAGFVPRTRGVAEDRRGARPASSVARAEPNRGAARVVGCRQVDHRQRARGRGVARDEGGS